MEWVPTRRIHFIVVDGQLRIDRVSAKSERLLGAEWHTAMASWIRENVEPLRGSTCAEGM
jgi:hypothetical protein